ncbi:MAG: TasA family protein [Candidatus Paceibacterota bacterium]
MKKILISLSIIGAVAAIAVGGTIAYFSDTETSTGNTFTAGTLVFNINDPVAAGHQVFSVTNMKPGDVKTSYLVVTNDGTIDQKWKAWLTETGAGTLDDELMIKWTINPTDYPGSLPSEYTSAGPVNGLIQDWTYIGALGTMTWASPGAVAFAPDWAAVYKIEVRMDTDAGNGYQSANYTGDLNFFATQYEKDGWE